MDSENSPPQFQAKKTLHLLPREIIEEILAKLPVKSLLRLRCVSKSWRSSIDSRFFINKHLRHSTQQRVMCNHTILGLNQRSVRSYLKEPDLDPSPIDDPNNNHLMTGSTVVGSCNGLLCILKEKSFFLWNPTTRLSVELPKIDLQMTKYGFGWDEEADAYKVFALVSQPNQNLHMGKVYSSRTNSWKTVKHGCLSLHNAVGVFACGKIHWLTKSGREIESFDLKSDVFGMMEQPCEPGVDMWVKEKSGCLSVSCSYNRTRLDVWIMEKYGVKESWVKRNTATIPLECKYNYIVIYNRHDKGITFLPHKRTDNYAVSYYIESLVSPVCSTRQEIEREQIQASVAEGRPKRPIKRRRAFPYKKRRPAPARQNKRRAAGSGVKVTQESKEMEKERHTSVVDGRPKRQNKIRAVQYGVEGTKENQEMEKEQVHTTVAEGRPKRQNRRRPARYGDQETKENPEIEKEQVRATCVNEGPPKRQNKRKEMEQEQVHTSVDEGRPKRQNRRRPVRYDT